MSAGMSLIHVTKQGRCAHCGARVAKCTVCQLFFHPTRRGHVICGDKCRKRLSRENKDIDTLFASK